MTLLYNAVLLVVDLLAVWWFHWRKTLRVWFGVMVAANVCSLALAGGIAARYENHFGFFRLLAYGIFLHNVLLLAATVLIWRRIRPRLALGALAAGIGLSLVAVDAFLIEPHWLEVSNYRIASSRIHNPVRVAVLADIQTERIGPYEKSVLQQALDQNPDVILFAGDYLQTAFSRHPQLLAELNDYLREIHFSAPLGVYAVSGNIDSYLWQNGFKGTGVITVPITKSFDLGDVRLTCLGLYESFNNRLKLPNPQPDRFHLVLGHTPNYAMGAVTADLMVAGHTHGGQVQLPFIGPMITHSVIPHRWAAGLTDLPAGGKLLVSRGIGMERGHAPPMRFLCRPELVVIDLVPEKSDREDSADDRG